MSSHPSAGPSTGHTSPDRLGVAGDDRRPEAANGAGCGR
ncbi:hypothetical protein Ae168Ps1_2118 [Pseudonocardia sp. Ae168_Ps1]|nr:hypothetical protein Ae150APs1_2112 [Pseudonocardia sp. Ae150A_Ps1]OLL79712.1 hypothetical protein Ae168Ps1_2118 [Pseudonocardia sp. Ae168_Ps1]OLL86152.1 hypothetical protein Ae263Ps1_3207c [Pseudonocardia sp. Ae263_Ps1]OLL93817.1 hypothetical protein Ae356Ps1_3714 [Pseudonocardia sp. Ae356_Ps1]